MSENTANPNEILTAWGTDLAAAYCAHCQTGFLVACDTLPAKCPNCFQASLEIAPNGLPALPHPYPPELILPFRLSEAQLSEAMRRFTASIPFAPPQLNPTELRSHLATVFLPMWLVDSSVSACWQAEVGFDYQVISHQEIYDQNSSSWKTNEVKEARVRWENRVGRLNRMYQNVTTPALDHAQTLEKQIGRFELGSAQSYAPENIRQATIRATDRPPKASWTEAAAAFQKTAADDCQHACAGGHIRQFRWKARFTRLNWTLMLLPVYTTYYRDDDGETQTVLIHGQTGATSGARRASGRRAARTGLVILVLGILLCLAGFLLDTDPAANLAQSTLATVLVVTGIAGILTACIPYLIAWDFNRRQKLEAAARI